MANYTQKLILDTFESMLDRMPFDKITVTALIKECNIGRNTFYYHYDDIYALLDEWLRIKLGELANPDDQPEWQDVLKAVLYGCRANKRKIYNIYSSLSRDRMEYYLFGQPNSLISEHVERLCEAQRIDPERAQTVAEIIEYTAYGFFMRFLRGGMKADIESSVNKLGSVLEEMINSLAR